MSFKLIASPGKVIVQSDGFTYQGKLVIPETAKRRPTTGTVVAVGDDVGQWRTETEIREEEGQAGEKVQVPYERSIFKPRYLIGDRVCFGLYSGVLLKIKEVPAYVVLNQDEILCTIVGEATLEATGETP